MTNLTLNQRVTLNDINLAPKHHHSFRRNDTFKFQGVISGKWDKRALNSLENKGLIDVIGLNDFGGQFVIVNELGRE